jgi:signal transduction histidine kinase
MAGLLSFGAVLPVALAVRKPLLAWQSGRALAEQTELTELERARRAVLEERTRIAREMHDVAAHHMSMIRSWLGSLSWLSEVPALVETAPADSC